MRPEEVNYQRRAAREVCQTLDLTNHKFKKLNKKYKFATYNLINHFYYLDLEALKTAGIKYDNKERLEQPETDGH